MLKNTFSVGIFFSSIEFFAHKLRRFKNGVFLLDRTVDISAAGIARFTSILSTNPLYLLKTRIESGMLGKETSIIESAKEIRRHSGLAGFYKGFWATMIRDVPYQGLQFSVYILLGELFGSFKQKQDDQLGIVRSPSREGQRFIRDISHRCDQLGNSLHRHPAVRRSQGRSA